MQEYVDNLELIDIALDRGANPEEPLTSWEKSVLRATVGVLGWLARMMDGGLCFGVSCLQHRQPIATVKNLTEANKLVNQAKSTQW